MVARSTERGAALVEVAMIGGILLGLVLSVVDLAFAAFDSQTTNFAVRATARSAATAEIAPDAGCHLADVVSSGDVQAFRRLACATKNRSSVDPRRMRVKVRLEVSDDPTIAGDGTSGDSVRVCAMTQGRSLSGVFGKLFDGRVFTAQTVTRIEQPVGTAGSIVAGYESPFVGHDWSFCDSSPLPSGFGQIATTTAAPTTTTPIATTSVATTSVATTSAAPTTAAPTTTTPSGYCSVTWEITAEGSNWYDLVGRVRNKTGAAWSGYSVVFAIPNGHSVAAVFAGWGSFTQTGTTVTLTKPSSAWIGTLAAGQWTGSNGGVGVRVNKPAGEAIIASSVSGASISGHNCTSL